MLNESARQALSLAESMGACKNHELVLRILEKHGCFAQQTQQAVLTVAQPTPLPSTEKPAKAKRNASKGKPWTLERILSTLVRGGTVNGGGVLSYAKFDGRTIQATDYDVVVEVDCPSEVGRGCIAPKALPKGVDGLTFSVDGKTVQAGCATLDTFLVEDFPRIEKPSLDTLTGAGRLNLSDLRTVSACMSDDPARMNLNGVFFDPDGSLVSTDGHRMMIAKGTDTRPPENRIPHRAWVKAVLSWFSDLESVPIWYSQGEVVTQVTLDGYTVRIFGRCIDEEYPNYRGVIPSSCPVNVTILGSTIDKIRHLGRVKTHADPLVFTRSGVAYDYRGKQLERVAWSVPGSGLDSLPDNMKLGLDRKFVEDLPDCESWAVGVIATDNPTKWTSGNLTAILMPMDLPN